MKAIDTMCQSGYYSPCLLAPGMQDWESNGLSPAGSHVGIGGFPSHRLYARANVRVSRARFVRRCYE